MRRKMEAQSREQMISKTSDGIVLDTGDGRGDLTAEQEQALRQREQLLDGSLKKVSSKMAKRRKRYDTLEKAFEYLKDEMEEPDTRSLVERYIEGEDDIFQIYHYIQRVKNDETKARRKLQKVTEEMDKFNVRMRTDQARKIKTRAELEGMRDSIRAKAAALKKDTEKKEQMMETWTGHMRRILDMPITRGLKFTSPALRKERCTRLGIKKEEIVVVAGAQRLQASRKVGRRGSALYGNKDFRKAQSSAVQAQIAKQEAAKRARHQLKIQAQLMELEEEKKRKKEARKQKKKKRKVGIGTAAAAATAAGGGLVPFPDGDSNTRSPDDSKSGGGMEAFPGGGDDDMEAFPGGGDDDMEAFPGGNDDSDTEAFPGGGGDGGMEAFPGDGKESFPGGRDDVGEEKKVLPTRVDFMNDFRAQFPGVFAADARKVKETFPGDDGPERFPGDDTPSEDTDSESPEYGYDFSIAKKVQMGVTEKEDPPPIISKVDAIQQLGSLLEEACRECAEKYLHYLHKREQELSSKVAFDIYEMKRKERASSVPATPQQVDDLERQKEKLEEVKRLCQELGVHGHVQMHGAAGPMFGLLGAPSTQRLSRHERTSRYEQTSAAMPELPSEFDEAQFINPHLRRKEEALARQELDEESLAAMDELKEAKKKIVELRVGRAGRSGPAEIRMTSKYIREHELEDEDEVKHGEEIRRAHGVLSPRFLRANPAVLGTLAGLKHYGRGSDSSGEESSDGGDENGSRWRLSRKSSRKSNAAPRSRQSSARRRRSSVSRGAAAAAAEAVTTTTTTTPTTAATASSEAPVVRRRSSVSRAASHASLRTTASPRSPSSSPRSNKKKNEVAPKVKVASGDKKEEKKTKKATKRKVQKRGSR